MKPHGQGPSGTLQKGPRCYLHSDGENDTWGWVEVSIPEGEAAKGTVDGDARVGGAKGSCFDGEEIGPELDGAVRGERALLGDHSAGEIHESKESGVEALNDGGLELGEAEGGEAAGDHPVVIVESGDEEVGKGLWLAVLGSEVADQACGMKLKRRGEEDRRGAGFAGRGEDPEEGTGAGQGGVADIGQGDAPQGGVVPELEGFGGQERLTRVVEEVGELGERLVLDDGDRGAIRILADPKGAEGRVGGGIDGDEEFGPDLRVDFGEDGDLRGVPDDRDQGYEAIGGDGGRIGGHGWS